MKPRTTLMVFIQEPDFGACFNHVGNKAKSVNGSAKARANPNIPSAGPIILPCVLTSTSRKPIIGPVQEKLTSVSVKAIRKMESRPLVLPAFESTALLHLDGRRISNHPKKLSANTTSNRKKKMLNTALVANALSDEAPNRAVISRPRAR